MKLKFFIHRPIFASVIALIIMLCGIAAMFNLPLEEYPNISPPSIVVQASYPGASAETAEKTIAAQFENKLNGVSGVIYMASNSTGSGSVSVRLTFAVGTNLNYAVNEVLNRVHAAMPLLPEIVQRLGVTVRRSSPDFLMTIDFFNNGSGNFDQYFLSNYINRTINNDMALVPGVGSVNIYAETYAMRVWLNVNNMNSLNVSPNDIAQAINDQSHEYVVGRTVTNDPNRSSTFNLLGGEMYSTPEQFSNIIVRESGTQIVRVKDVARVELGGYSYNWIPNALFYQDGRLENKQVVVAQIFMDPEANQLEVKQKVMERLKQDAKNFPHGVSYHIGFDATQFVTASINNVTYALFEAFALVALILFLFLHDYRTSLIALITIPVSVLGAFAFLYILGYSINTLTLFALILAIGIVVDDAIVVVENIERIKRTNPNLPIKQVVEMALHEVFGAVIAIALVLSVVFFPVMALSGLSGVLYRQFAVTIASTVIISAITALTFTPAISALLLNHQDNLGKFAKRFDAAIHRLTNSYLYLSQRIIAWGKYVIISIIVVLLSLVLMFKIIPLSFIPNEDQGYYLISVNLPTSSSLSQTEELSQKISADIMKNPAVLEVLQIVGVDFLSGAGANNYASSLIVRLKTWDKRMKPHQDVDSLIAYTNGLNGKYKNATIRAFNRPPIPGLSTTGGVEFYLEARSNGDINELAKTADLLDKLLSKHKEIEKAYHILDTNVEQVSVIPDVDKVKFYKANVLDVYNTLQSVYSNYNVNFAYLMQGLIWVILQADANFRMGINNISNVYVKSTKGNLIPVNSLVKISYFKSPQVIERFNDYVATKEIVSPKKGYSSGDIMKIIETEMQNLPIGYNYDWFGVSYQQKMAQHNSIQAFIFSLLMIYLVLCALYEMWRLPLVVLLGIPFALFGSGLMLLLRGQPNDLYFQISLMALLGLSAKNIILLIEFANVRLQQGHTPIDSAIYALKIRFRPILMTSVTFIMGALPLVFAKGAGANAEHSVGTGIIGGMLGSVILGTLFTPAYFVWIMKNYRRKKED